MTSQLFAVTSQLFAATSQPWAMTSRLWETVSQRWEVEPQSLEPASQRWEVTPQDWEMTSQSLKTVREDWEIASHRRAVTLRSWVPVYTSEDAIRSRGSEGRASGRGEPTLRAGANGACPSAWETRAGSLPEGQWARPGDGAPRASTSAPGGPDSFKVHVRDHRMSLLAQVSATLTAAGVRHAIIGAIRRSSEGSPTSHHAMPSSGRRSWQTDPVSPQIPATAPPPRLSLRTLRSAETAR